MIWTAVTRPNDRAVAIGFGLFGPIMVTLVALGYDYFAGLEAARVVPFEIDAAARRLRIDGGERPLSDLAAVQLCRVTYLIRGRRAVSIG